MGRHLRPRPSPGLRVLETAGSSSAQDQHPYLVKVGECGRPRRHPSPPSASECGHPLCCLCPSSLSMSVFVRESACEREHVFVKALRLKRFGKLGVRGTVPPPGPVQCSSPSFAAAAAALYVAMLGVHILRIMLVRSFAFETNCARPLTAFQTLCLPTAPLSLVQSFRLSFDYLSGYMNPNFTRVSS